MQQTNLDDFIYSFFENITNISGELKNFTIGNPNLSKDCNKIIKNALREDMAFIDISSNSNSFKKIANVVMHIFYSSPLITKISKSPLDQYLKINDFKYLIGVENHQNAIIAIAYGLALLNKEFDEEINFSCHYFVDLTQTLCLLDIKNLEQVISATKYLSLIFEQITYKNNILEYSLCPTF